MTSWMLRKSLQPMLPFLSFMPRAVFARCSVMIFGSSLVQVVSRDVLAGDSLEELRLEVEVATVVAVLRRALRHRPYPVAQGQRVMQHVGDDGPPAEVDLVVVDRRVVLCLGRCASSPPHSSAAICCLSSCGRPQLQDVHDASESLASRLKMHCSAGRRPGHRTQWRGEPASRGS